MIFWKNTKKPNPEDLIEWISEIWWSDTISAATITHSFKKAGINLLSNGNEDCTFQWPKKTDITIIEDIYEIKNKNVSEPLNFDFKSSKNEDIEEDIDDILFNYDRYDIKCIRKEALKEIQSNNIDKEVYEEEGYNSKNYDYYKCYGFIK